MKRPNPPLTGIEGDEFQATGIKNILNKTAKEIFLNLREEVYIRCTENQTGPEKKSTILFSVKITQNRGIEYHKTEGSRCAQKCKPLRITTDFSLGTLKFRKA